MASSKLIYDTSLEGDRLLKHVALATFTAYSADAVITSKNTRDLAQSIIAVHVNATTIKHTIVDIKMNK